MKKIVNQNFVLSMIIVAAMVLVCIFFGFVMSDVGEGMDYLRNDISQTVENGEVGDVEGYAMIIQGIGYGFGAFANVLLFGVVLLVGFYGFLLFIVALIARLVYKSEGKRLVVYRVLMGIEYVLQAGLFWVLGEMMISNFNLIMLVVILLLLAEIIYGVINTYTKRICES